MEGKKRKYNYDFPANFPEKSAQICTPPTADRRKGGKEEKEGEKKGDSLYISFPYFSIMRTLKAARGKG